MYRNTTIIAEVKTSSPFGYKAEKSWDELFFLAQEVGDIISIHTDGRWDGSFELIKKARALTTKPILAKGIHANDEDIEKAISYGADLVLVVGRVPSVQIEKCLIEPLTLEELQSLPPDIKAVWNSRDLNNGKTKEVNFETARENFSGWLCQASNLKTTADINQKADAVLVGTHLLTFAQSLII